MATDIEGIFQKDLHDLITSSKLLVVGAGGIGCELLKNLVLTGFKDIHIIDLDTIEVSNLNRQFLFRREHVGRPKSLVAKESALLFNPNVNITAYHDSITEQKYDVNFYKQFSLVMNALDNRAARSHVNRMCLAANVSLIESGSSGYNGHVTLHRKGVSECYDCTQRAHQKTFPGCTIRNTPSEPIHCIVWSKHLFNQLFGLADPDEDVSPDSADPEAIGNAGKAALEQNSEEKKTAKISTRQWAQNNEYDSQKLFNKLFCEDIKYLLSMESLWKQRRPPTPLDWNNLPDAVASSSSSDVITPALKDQRIWSMAECAKVFEECVTVLKKRLLASRMGDCLVWDKDDNAAMDFVTSCSNIRCHIFGIAQKSRFDTKSMAGNIIPAIASTNAVVGGLIVMFSFRVMREEYHKCNGIFVSPRINVKKQLFSFDAIAAPNPKCYVCAEKPEMVVKVDLEKMTIRLLGDKVLKKEFCMIAPDVEIDDGKGTILISSEEGETDDIADKLLKDFNINAGTRLKCDDFLQNYQLNITIESMTVNEEDREKIGEIYEISGDRSQLNPQEEKAAVSGNGASTSTAVSVTGDLQLVDDDDEPLILEEHDEVQTVGVKRPLPSANESLPVKKRRLDEVKDKEDVEIETVDLD